MGPHDKPDHRDSDAGRGDEVITKNRLAREGRDYFADHSHRWKNHDVHGWMRVKPEKVLKQDRVAAVGWVKKSQVEHSFQSCEQQGDGDHRCSKNKNDARRIVRPDKQRQAQPGHPRCAHSVYRDDEVQTGQNRRKTIDKDPDDCRRDGGIRIDAAQRCIKRPTRIEPAGRKRIQNKRPTHQIDIPAQ